VPEVVGVRREKVEFWVPAMIGLVLVLVLWCIDFIDRLRGQSPGKVKMELSDFTTLIILP